MNAVERASRQLPGLTTKLLRAIQEQANYSLAWDSLDLIALNTHPTVKHGELFDAVTAAVEELTIRGQVWSNYAKVQLIATGWLKMQGAEA